MEKIDDIANYITQTEKMVQDIIDECREKESRVDGFGIQFLDQLKEDNALPENIYLAIKKCVENPEAKFTLRINQG